MNNDSTYYYVITALNSDGQSIYSSPVSAIPTPAALPGPKNIRAYSGNGEVTIAWDAVISAVNYNVYRITSNGSITRLLPPAQGGIYTDRSAINGVQCHYVVQTMSTNPGAFSYTVAAYPFSSVPKAPTSLVATPGDTWASLSWASSTGALNYLVYHATSRGGPFTFRGSVKATSFQDTGLSNTTSYYYVIAAVNVNGSSAFSPEASVSPSLLAPPLPVILTGWPRDGSAYLTYSGASKAVSYSVYRGKTSGFYPRGILIDIVDKLYYTDNTLTNDTTYYYIVETNNASVYKPRSNEFRVTPVENLPPPTIPSTFLEKPNGAFPGNTQATITWLPIASAYSYSVQYAETAGGPYSTAGSVSAGKTSFTKTVLTNNQPYFFRVKANLYGTPTTNYTRGISVIPSADLPLAPCTISGEAGNSQTSLRWDAVTGATGYHVYRRTAFSSWQRISQSPVSVTFYYDSGLTNGTTYYYITMSLNGSGTGAWAISEKGLTPQESNNLAPTSVVGIPGNTQVTVNWKPAQGAEDYDIEIAESPGGPRYKSGYTSQGKTSYTVTGLTNGKNYYARVRANSAYSAYILVTPQTPYPQAPTSLSSRTGNTEVSLTWGAVENVTGYNIYRRTHPGSNPVALVGQVTGTLFTDTDLDNGTVYYYSVSAVNASGEGPRSAYEVRESPNASLMSAPTNLTGVKGNTQITVTWDPVVGATNYSVTVANTPGGTALNYAATSNGKTSATITNLTNGQTYYVRIHTSSPAASVEYGEIAISPSVLLPLAPASLTCNAPGNTQATINWRSIDDAVRYLIYRRTKENGWSAEPIGESASPTFTDSDLTNAIPYYYVISALNNHGEGAWSQYEAVCTPSSSKPLAPTNVKAISGDKQVSLSWNMVNDATQYRILRAESPGGPYNYSYSIGDTSYVATNLQNNKRYFFCIQARSTTAELSAYSPEVFALPSTGFIDKDRDELADDWELSYSADLSTFDNGSDFDGDCYTDLIEYLNWKNGINDPYGSQFNPKDINAPYGYGYTDVIPEGNTIIAPILHLLLGD